MRRIKRESVELYAIGGILLVVSFSIAFSILNNKNTVFSTNSENKKATVVEKIEKQDETTISEETSNLENESNDVEQTSTKSIMQEKPITQVSTEKKEVEQATNNGNQTSKSLDLTKCINNDYSYVYSNPKAVNVRDDISIEINDDRRSAMIRINWNSFGFYGGNDIEPLTGIIGYPAIGFSKNIKSAFIGSRGQDKMGTTFFFLMEDGTVRYASMFERSLTNSVLSYRLAVQHSYNGKRFVVNDFSSVSDIVEFYTVDVQSEVGSYMSTIAVRSDGQFYDLGSIIDF